MGRSSIYTEPLADEICDLLSQGHSLLSICLRDGFPAESTVRGWVIDDREGFAAKYARARDMGLDHHADAIIQIADTCEIGTKETTKEWGTEISKGDMVDRSRLKIDARKWYLSKLAPKKYGDKIETTHQIGDSLQDLYDTIRKK